METGGWGTAEETTRFSIADVSLAANPVELSDGELTIPSQPPGGRWEKMQIAGFDDDESNKFLAVGGGTGIAWTSDGTLAITDDGVSWEVVDPGFDVVPTRMSWANGRFSG